MTSLARYHARSPRYILNTEDDSLIRVAGPKQTPWEEGTSIRNVSLTGLAFTAPADLCPVLGEVVKIQFIPPGTKQIACHGVVTRIDEEGKDSKLVGLHFYKMEMAHRIALAQGLAHKIKEQQDRTNNDFIFASAQNSNIANKIPSLFFMLAIATLWTTCLYLYIHYGYQGLYNLLTNL